MVGKLFEFIVMMVLIAIAAYIAMSIFNVILQGGIAVTILFILFAGIAVFYTVKSFA